MELKITLDIKAEPFQRTKKGKYGFYNPQIIYINTLKELLKPFAPKEPVTGPVAIKYLFYLKPPQSWSNKKIARALSGELRHATYPDASNLHYPCENALKGLIIADDKQIVEYSVRKEYAQEDMIEIILKVI